MSGRLCQILAGVHLGNACKYVGLGRVKFSVPGGLLVVFLTLFAVGRAFAEEPPAPIDPPPEPASEETESPLSGDIEDLKKAALELNRDLLILEEELLFPSNTQIVVFLSVDVGTYFRLDAVKLNIDDQLVASSLYTARQNDALSRGGIQRLYMGNLKSGEHEITAFFTGIGPDDREYKRAATLVIDKDDDPKMLELRVRDSTANMQPEFDFKEWEL